MACKKTLFAHLMKSAYFLQKLALGMGFQEEVMLYEGNAPEFRIKTDHGL